MKVGLLSTGILMNLLAEWRSKYRIQITMGDQVFYLSVSPHKLEMDLDDLYLKQSSDLKDILASALRWIHKKEEKPLTRKMVDNWVKEIDG